MMSNNIDKKIDKKLSKNLKNMQSAESQECDDNEDAESLIPRKKPFFNIEQILSEVWKMSLQSNTKT